MGVVEQDPTSGPCCIVKQSYESPHACNAHQIAMCTCKSLPVSPLVCKDSAPFFHTVYGFPSRTGVDSEIAHASRFYFERMCLSQLAVIKHTTGHARPCTRNVVVKR